MNQQEQHIRQLAYDIWESEGRPEGQEARHWEMARKLVETQGGAGTPTAKPTGKARRTTTKPVDATPSAKAGKKSAGGGQSVKPAKTAAPSKGKPNLDLQPTPMPRQARLKISRKPVPHDRPKKAASSSKRWRFLIPLRGLAVRDVALEKP